MSVARRRQVTSEEVSGVIADVRAAVDVMRADRERRLHTAAVLDTAAERLEELLARLKDSDDQ
jgi:hypothetical protein